MRLPFSWVIAAKIDAMPNQLDSKDFSKINFLLLWRWSRKSGTRLQVLSCDPRSCASFRFPLVAHSSTCFLLASFARSIAFSTTINYSEHFQKKSGIVEWRQRQWPLRENAKKTPSARRVPVSERQIQMNVRRLRRRGVLRRHFIGAEMGSVAVVRNPRSTTSKQRNFRRVKRANSGVTNADWTRTRCLKKR